MKTPEESARSVVEFDDVSFRYDRGPAVLNALNFRLEAGSFHFLSGASGAGKTTLVRLILMSLKPSSGAVWLFGTDTTRLSPAALTSTRRRMGIVFQDFRLLDHLTTYQNVALPLIVQGYDETAFRGEVVELLQWVDLGDRLDAYPASLSGGEKQRAAIARAVIAKPEVVLADEPTGNVDPDLARRLMHLFLELNRLGTSVVIATHDVALMNQIDAARLILVGGSLYLDR